MITMMKKFFLVLGLLGMVTACSLNDDDGANLRLERLAVDSVDIPDTLVYGEQYSFPVSYTQPSDCYGFYGFNYGGQDSTRIIEVINSVSTTMTCDSTAVVDTRDLDFEVRYENTYVFKFYQGVDASGDPIYLTKNVPVKRQ